jgi:hypothetical protein
MVRSSAVELPDRTATNPDRPGPTRTAPRRGPMTHEPDRTMVRVVDIDSGLAESPARSRTAQPRVRVDLGPSTK